MSGGWASSYVGLPYQLLNCWQLVRLVYLDRLGIELPLYGEVDAHDQVRIARELRRGAASEVWRQVRPAQELDVVLLAGRSQVAHVGVMVDERRLLHTERASGAVLVPITSFLVSGRIRGYYRHHTVDKP